MFAEDERKEKQESGDDTKLVPDLTYEQHPGLAYAASKIYFTDQRYSLSGFGEINAVHYGGDKPVDSGDLELFYSNLYRFSTFFGYKVRENLIFNFEFLGELLHDGRREIGQDIVIEAMLDWMIHRRFNLRFGYYPLPLGYINNNDEPVMFFSVNRPEVERLIIPSSWISLGTMAFGVLLARMSYSVGLVGGLDSGEFIGGSWIRQGRRIHHGVPKDAAVVGKLEWRGIPRFVAGVSGYHGGSGDGRVVDGRPLGANVTVGAVHAKYETERWRLLGVAAVGGLTDTPQLHTLTGHVLGKESFGYYVESGYDILPSFTGRVSRRKLPLFVRYERLNTHRDVAPELRNLPRFENDLRVVTVGANFNLKRSVVFKGNYQFRQNLFANSMLREGNRAEFGFGFIF